MSTETGEATGIEIYNILMAGKKVKLTFPTVYEANKLRNNISTIKYRQDKLAVKLGLFEESDITAFTAVFTSKEPPNVVVIFSFDPSDKRQPKKFSYEIVDTVHMLSNDDGKQ